MTQPDVNETLEMAAARLMNTIGRLDDALSQSEAERQTLKEEAERLRSLCRGQAERIGHLEAELSSLQRKKSAVAMRLDGAIAQVERLAGSAA